MVASVSAGSVTFVRTSGMAGPSICEDVCNVVCKDSTPVRVSPPGDPSAPDARLAAPSGAHPALPPPPPPALGQRQRDEHQLVDLALELGHGRFGDRDADLAERRLELVPEIAAPHFVQRVCAVDDDPAHPVLLDEGAAKPRVELCLLYTSDAA